MKLYEILEKLTNFTEVEIISFIDNTKVLIANDFAINVDSDLFLTSYQDWKRKVLKIYIENKKLVIVIE